MTSTLFWAFCLHVVAINGHFLNFKFDSIVKDALKNVHHEAHQTISNDIQDIQENSQINPKTKHDILEVQKLLRASSNSVKSLNKTHEEMKNMNVTTIETKVSGTVSDSDVCDHAYLDGCSIPFGLPFFFKSVFTPSCWRHDVCYRCGVDYAVDRRRCDVEFRENMDMACRDEYLRHTLHHRHRPLSNGIYKGIGPENDSDSSKLIPHKKRVLKALGLLRGQFDKILRDELSGLHLTHPGSFVPISNKDVRFNRTQFERHIKAKAKFIIKSWAELLHRKLLFTENVDYLRTESFKIDNDYFSKPNNSRTVPQITNMEVVQKVFLGKLSQDSKTSDAAITPNDKTHKSQEVLRSVDDESTADIIKLTLKKCKIAKESDDESNIFGELCHDIVADIKTIIDTNKITSLGSTLEGLPDSLELLFCLFNRDVYYWGVRIGGGPSYQKVARDFCGEAYVPQCLPSS